MAVGIHTQPRVLRPWRRHGMTGKIMAMLAAALVAACLHKAAAQQDAAPLGTDAPLGPSPNEQALQQSDQLQTSTAAASPSSQLGTQGAAVTTQNIQTGQQANRLGFTDRDTLPPNGGYAVYNFDTREPGLGIPDVLLTAKSSPSPVAMYCNPSWLTRDSGDNKIAGPLNAIWQFNGQTSPGNIYLSADNPIARPPEARVPGTAQYDSFTPSYNCTVINYDADLPAHYTLSATFNFHDIILNDQEQAAITMIWNECCRGRIRDAELQIRTASDGLLDPELRNLTCGQWVAINEANQQTPFTDFCNVVGSACNAQGQLTQFSLNGWNLGGTFPVDQLTRFSVLSEIDISNNPAMAADLKAMFDAFATLENLQVVELTNNAGMSGTFGYEATEENNRRSALCVTAEGGLRVLNMNGLGLGGLALPACLLGPHSTLEEVRLAQNGIVGSIPDNFDNTSPLQYLSMRGNQLTGTIPETLGQAGDLTTLDLAANQLTGDVPSNLGHPVGLRFVHLGFNSLTGSIPSSLALHDTLEALDVRNNNLDMVPEEWIRASTARIALAPLVYLRIANNQLKGAFPQTLALLPKLAVLDMKNNNFTSSLPAIRGMFTALRYFDASNNSFSGFIPAAFSDAGIVRLKPTEAALIKQFETPDSDNPSQLETIGRVSFQQIFNVSGNSLVGTPPIWMYKDNMPTWAAAGIDIHSNNLTIDCAAALPTQLAYLTKARACPQTPSGAALKGLQSATAAREGAAAPVGAAPQVSPDAAPAVVEAVVEPALAPADFNTSGGAEALTPAGVEAAVADNPVAGNATTASSNGTAGGGGGGLPGWGKAVISVGVILIVLLAAALVFVLVKRRSPGHERGFVTRFSGMRPSGFAKFQDAADAETGNGFGNGNVQMSSRDGDIKSTHYSNGGTNGFTTGDTMTHRS